MSLFRKNYLELAKQSFHIASEFYKNYEFQACKTECEKALDLLNSDKQGDSNLKLDIVCLAGDACYFQKEYHPALLYFKQSVNILKRFQGNNKKLIEQITNVGLCLTWLDSDKESITHFSEALKLAKITYGKNSESYFSQQIWLANAFYYTSKYEAAENIYQNAILFRETNFEKNDDELIRYKNLAARCYKASKKYAEAYRWYKDVYFYSDAEDVENEIKLIKQIIELAEEIKTDDNLDEYYESLVSHLQNKNEKESEIAELANKTGKYFSGKKNYSKAEEYLKIAADIYEKLNGKSDGKFQKTAQLLSVVYYHLSNYEKAAEITKYLLEEDRKKQGNEKNILSLLTNLGYIFYWNDEYSKSEKYFKEAYDLSETLNGPFAESTVNIILKIADVYYWQDKYEQSINHLLSFVEEYSAGNNPDIIILAETYTKIAKSYYYMAGKSNDAIFYYQKALEIYNTGNGLKHKTTLDILYEISKVYYDKLKNYDQSLHYFNLYLENAQNVIAEYDTDVLRTQHRLAELKFQQLNKTSESEKLVKKMLFVISDFIEKNPDNVKNEVYLIKVDLLLLLVEIYIDQSKIIEAKEVLDEAHQLCREHCKNSARQYNRLTDLLSKLSGAADNFTPVDTDRNKEEYIRFIREKINDPQHKRKVRVFISSTFRDMMAEREYLIKRVFPKLKTLCREHGIDFSEVDLRWGVTEEEAKQGKVIEICLDEIDRSRPYFIGILGERYGWVPSPEDAANYDRIIHKYDWIKGDFEQGLSITEMEIQYGVLRNPAMQGNAFFYLRNEELTPENPEFKETQGTILHQKLEKLKLNLKGQQSFPVKDFETLDQLGDFIYNDLLNLIFSDDDLEVKENSLQQKMIEQIDFMKLYSGFYVPLEESNAKFEQFLEGTNNKLLLSGGQGNGKTAFLANWLCNDTEKFDDYFPVFYFADAGSGNKNFDAVLSQMTAQLQDVFSGIADFREDAPNPAQLFAKVLESVPEDEKVLFIIDGVDKLNQNTFYGPLYWLPAQIPGNVKIIFSAGDENIRQNLASHDFETVEFSGLNAETKEKFISGYLWKFGKKLSQQTTTKILSCNLTENPLSLKVLLDELRIFGSHEELENHLQFYLDAENTVELFGKLLKRVESDYEEKTKRFVGNVLSVILLSKSGIREHEILDICGIPQLSWSPVYSALENYIISSNGKLVIRNAALRKAIEKRYLTDNNSITEKYILLADYFEKSDDPQRKLEELAWHLFHSHQLKELLRYVVKIDVFSELYYAEPDQFTIYFSELKKKFDLGFEFENSMEEYQTGASFNPETLATSLHRISQLFGNNGDTEYRNIFAEKAFIVRNENFGEETAAKAEGLIDLANACKSKQEYQKARDYLLQSIEIFNKNQGYKPVKKAMAYNKLAEISLKLNEIDTAENYALKALKLYQDLMGEDNLAISTCYYTLAEIEQEKNELQKALDYADNALKIARKFAGEEHISVSWILTLKADVYEKMYGDEAYEYAMPLYMEVYKIQQKNLGDSHILSLATMLSMANLLFDANLYGEAKECLAENLEKCKICLGETHELTQNYQVLYLTNENELAFATMKEEKYQEGLSILMDNFEKSEEILGLKHTVTQSTVRMLVWYFETIEDVEKAAFMREYLVQ
jgi:tetratricopeptide (TPR) repeat protein